MISLAIDASTYAGSVAVTRNGAVLAELAVAMRGAETEGLMPSIPQVLDAAGVAAWELDRLICGAGPGSFTSLRIAASIAKGLVVGLRIPLFEVSSLALLVGSSRVAPGRYVATLDAQRGEWFATMFDKEQGGLVRQLGAPRIVSRPDLELLSAEAQAPCIGAAGAGEPATPEAGAVIALEDTMSHPVDPAAWEPLYGRLAEAQVKWEAVHGRPLTSE